MILFGHVREMRRELYNNVHWIYFAHLSSKPKKIGRMKDKESVLMTVGEWALTLAVVGLLGLLLGALG